MEGKLGSVRIAPQVLTTIARLTALSVPGVLRMHQDLSSGVDRLLRGKGGGGGVHIAVVDDAVTVDLWVIAERDTNLYELGLAIQNEVSRAITELVGMPVLAVNVHVEDVGEASSGG